MGHQGKRSHLASWPQFILPAKLLLQAAVGSEEEETGTKEPPRNTHILKVSRPRFSCWLLLCKLCDFGVVMGSLSPSVLMLKWDLG